MLGDHLDCRENNLHPHGADEAGPMKQISVSIYLTPSQVEDYYRGRARFVVAEAIDGRTVSLPIKVLHKYISKAGIRGHFVVTTDENYKFKHIDSVQLDDGKGCQLDQTG